MYSPDFRNNLYSVARIMRPILDHKEGFLIHPYSYQTIASLSRAGVPPGAVYLGKDNHFY